MMMDENLYYLENNEKIEAIGVKLNENPGYLAGLYMGWNRSDPKKIIDEIIENFHEAKFYDVGFGLETGLVCRMSININEHDLKTIGQNIKDYRKLRLEFLAIRAENPKPSLDLYYDENKKFWNYKISPLIVTANSNYFEDIY